MKNLYPTTIKLKIIKLPLDLQHREWTKRERTICIYPFPIQTNIFLNFVINQLVVLYGSYMIFFSLFIFSSLFCIICSLVNIAAVSFSVRPLSAVLSLYYLSCNLSCLIDTTLYCIISGPIKPHFHFYYKCMFIFMSLCF